MVRMYDSASILLVVSCISFLAQASYFFLTSRIVEFIRRNSVSTFADTNNLNESAFAPFNNNL